MIIEASEIRPNKTYEGRVNMTEWLTTGQMIDRLKVGEVAECQTGEKVKIFEKSNLPYFQGIEKAICWILEDGDSLPFYMSEGNRMSRWRILPNYVSFEEAMKALKEDKTVHFCCGDFNLEIKTYKAVNRINDVFGDITWEELIYGKWTIEP